MIKLPVETQWTGDYGRRLLATIEQALNSLRDSSDQRLVTTQHAAAKATREITLTPDDTNTVYIDARLSNVFNLTLDRNVTISNPAGLLSGQTINLHLIQDATGGRTVTWGDKWTFVNRINPTLSTDPGAKDLVSCQLHEATGELRASFLPNFGSGYSSPGGGGTTLTWANVGTGAGIFKEQVGTEVRFKTLAVGGDLSIDSSGDTIQISYTATTPTTVDQLDDLIDVDAPAPADGDRLTWSASAGAWVPQNNARQWTVGATWSNGNNVLAATVNKVNAIVSETGSIKACYVLTDGGAGSCVVDIRKVSFASYPPLSTDTICGGNKPTISSATALYDGALTSWTTSVTAGDVLQFVLESTSTFKMIQIILVIQKA